MPDSPKACLVIGVNNVIGAANLAPLRAAAAGAEKFASWAKAQGFETICTTDASVPVSIQQVRDKIKQIVDRAVYSQLLVYFAGHGVLKGWGAEIWLLSNAANDPNEAVNLSGSADAARASGIPHIVFISDACRSIISDMRLVQLSGSILFPIGASKKPPEIDTFFATLPGFPSYEVPAVDPVQKYKGVFTECLLDGLAGPDTSVCETVNDGSSSKIWVVSSRTLKPYLERTVPETATLIDFRLEQIPELRVESQPPKYLARLPQQPPAPSQLESPPLKPPLGVLRTIASKRQIESYFAPLTPILNVCSKEEALEDDPDFSTDVRRITAALGRESFETGTGLTVVGARIAKVALDESNVYADVLEENDTDHVLFLFRTEKKTSASILLRFDDGAGICVAVIPDFIGNVLVEGGRVVNVSYTPASSNPRFGEYQFLKPELDKRRAFVSVAARRGYLRVNAENTETFATYARDLNRLDPVFGTYAAYAYWQAGMKAELQAVFEWMSADTETPVPFDVALLAGKLSDNEAEVRIAPRVPMLTQGWLLLREDTPVPNWVRDAARFTLPSLWTTFSPEGVAHISKNLRRRK